MNLDELAIQYGTDKSSLHHDYCKVYELYFPPLRDQELTFLELGYGGHEDALKGGESAKMWKAYAPKWNVYTLDNEEKENVPESLIFIRASQDNKVLLEFLFHDKPLDIVIDDASHISSLTIKSFEILFPMLKSGGYYCIEDTHSSIHDFWYGKDESNEDPKKNGRKTITALNYFKNLTDACNNSLMKPEYQLPFDVDYVHFYKDLIVIKKK